MKNRIIAGVLFCALMLGVPVTHVGASKVNEPVASATASTNIIAVNLTTPSGSIRGLQLDDVRVFKGIPYAKPPVRFAPPEDVEPWTQPLNCENFGSAALQVKNKQLKHNLAMSENCLSLNVWTPAQSATEKLPVYVWIHGGGFALGTSTEDSFDGTAFAKSGIVTVTINYRLNVLGWLATEETLNRYGTTGNWGLLDQIKALEWVQKNIEAFGGDPARVTIGGESAGSYSVSGLIMSPLANGLFQNAIMESGSMLGLPGNSHYARGNLERNIEMGRQLSFTFGARDNAEGLNKLRAVNPNIFVQMTPLHFDFTDIPAFMIIPTYDGYVLPKKPLEVLRSGKLNRVNLLWGFNANEGSVFVPETTDQDKYEMLAAKMYGYDKSQTILQHFPIDDGHPAYQRARDILMHGMFATVMKPYADALSKEGMNVYSYYYNYVTPELAKKNMGAAHGREIEYAFGNLPPNATSEQKKVSQEMFSRWVNFIKNSDPNIGGSPSGVIWGKYNPQDFKVMIFDKTPVFAKNPICDDIAFMEDIMFGSNSTYFD